MKKSFLKFTAVLLLLCIALSFASCIKTSEAKDMANEIFACLSESRYEDAAALFHPSSGVTASELEALAGALSDSYEADVKKGISLDRTTGFQSSAYTTEVDGSLYELHMDVTVGDKALDAVIVIVRNDDGYGIMRLTFTE